MTIKFAHIRPKGSDNRQGGYTIAFRPVDGGVDYSVARCNPKDNFCKATGRLIAKGRLESGSNDNTGYLYTRATKYATIVGKLVPLVNAAIEIQARKASGNRKKKA